MKYNPDIHHRRSVRLKGYDYAKEGMYFVTICTQNRIHFFGDVENREMILNPFGEIAYREWEKLPERWPHIELGAFQIMPNHIHGVLLILRPYSMENGESVETQPEIPFSKIQWATRPYLGQIIGAYKSIVSTSCLNYHKENQPGVWLDKIWQRSFDDRIIRDTAAFNNISTYIINNPANCKSDKFFD